MFVYLILSEKRLIISEQKINNKDYHALLQSWGRIDVCRKISNAFCLGFIYGNDCKVKNLPEEFS